MKAQLFKYLNQLQSSYWFVPSVMAVGAIVLSVVTVGMDEWFSSDWPEKFPWFYSNKPEGARAVLATVAGSMITVAGVTFSLTLLAVSHTTSQFGPRLLTNFMRDRGNQITLGTFIATFLYCLLVLRTVRTAEEATEGVATAELVQAFVPHIAIMTALVLTLCSVGVLIFFFHHVPESMNLSNVVADLGRQLTSSVDELFPEMIGAEAPDEIERPSTQVPDQDLATPVKLGEGRDGYVQTLDESGLIETATENDLIVQLQFRPGDFIYREQVGFLVWSQDSVEEKLAQQLKDCIALGVARTPHQNLLFIIDQLVESAARALSPGVNDPFTAIICMRWLGNGLIVMAQRRDPERYRYDSDGNLRIIARSVSFDEVCGAIFDQLRPYYAADRNAAIQMMQTIAIVRRMTSDKRRQQVLNDHADKLLASAEMTHLARHDIERLRAADDRDHLEHEGESER